MHTTLRKNLHQCFSKLKSQSPSTQKDHSRPSRTTTSILIKNFNTLYDLSSSSDSDDTETITPDFSTVFASQRFFFSSPGLSNSILQESPPESDTLVAGGLAIPTYSPDPYTDFRQSMQEMVEARALVDVRADWDYLHQLLLCYFTLNPKNTHKFIIGAFADLLVSLLAPVDDRRRDSDVSGR
ncbi:hypothetical protein HHK36_020602 [Tetracentron sinense]|uniref:Transcription repressor n=1 Tax=Tetracentron sinense TaxID=13715 RepID=A0A834YRZ9_TETSI|nr:hypothetical protein HHK36_020602 [Tetracentron sinense]